MYQSMYVPRCVYLLLTLFVKLTGFGRHAEFEVRSNGIAAHAHGQLLAEGSGGAIMTIGSNDYTTTSHARLDIYANPSTGALILLLPYCCTRIGALMLLLSCCYSYIGTLIVVLSCWCSQTAALILLHSYWCCHVAALMLVLFNILVLSCWCSHVGALILLLCC